MRLGILWLKLVGREVTRDPPGRSARHKRTRLRRERLLPVKGGGKVDHQGGAKPDHFGMVQGVDLCDLQGWLERRPAPPLGGAFRPERKAPLPIAASCGVE